METHASLLHAKLLFSLGLGVQLPLLLDILLVVHDAVLGVHEYGSLRFSACLDARCFFGLQLEGVRSMLLFCSW